ncbi:MAG: sulfite exporter TauE/SafE family protein [Chloroflexi bacterium]|nr:sulfite exporter TauE/SafE family protein [Chloroflexota bacterium]
MRAATHLAPIVAGLTIAVVVAAAGAPDRGTLLLAAITAVVAGLAATSIGVFGAILVPGLLLLGIEAQVAAPLSLLLQVLVIPFGAWTHALEGHVRRSIAGPLIVGGVAGSVVGALATSFVPPDVAARAVALIIVVVGVIVVANLVSTQGGVQGPRPVGAPGGRRVGAIGVVAGLASGVSGAGWGPIGVKLLILAGVEPRHAVGSSLVGRVAMATAALVAYGLAAMASGALRVEPALVVVLLAGAAGSVMPGVSLIGHLGRHQAAAAIAVMSIALALPTAFGWTA